MTAAPRRDRPGSMRGSGSRWPGALAALLWTGLVLVGVGPALMELLDGRGLTGTLSGLPVLVTESAVIGLLLIGPPAFVLWRVRRAAKHVDRPGS